MPSSSDSYLKKAMPIGTGDFTLTFNITSTLMQGMAGDGLTGSGLCIMLVHSDATVNQLISQTTHDGLLVTWRNYNSSGLPQYLLQLRTRNVSAPSGYIYRERNCLLGYNYTVTIHRVAMNANIYIKNIDTGVVIYPTSTVIYDNTNIQYFVATCGKASAGGGTTSLESNGIIWNYLFTS